jgi:hypothetical protein
MAILRNRCYSLLRNGMRTHVPIDRADALKDPVFSGDRMQAEPGPLYSDRYSDLRLRMQKMVRRVLTSESQSRVFLQE